MARKGDDGKMQCRQLPLSWLSACRGQEDSAGYRNRWCVADPSGFFWSAVSWTSATACQRPSSGQALLLFPCTTLIDFRSILVLTKTGSCRGGATTLIVRKKSAHQSFIPFLIQQQHSANV